VTEPATTANETPVFFPAGDQTLFGVLTRPTSEPNGRVVVFLAGGGHTFLHRRVAVRLSRRVAEMGFHGFRFDYHGVGDSSGEVTGYRLDRPFVDDLMGAVRWLRAQGFNDFIVVGSCFGARTALAAAPQIEGLERLVLLNLHVRNIKRGEGAVTVPETWSRMDVIRRVSRADVLRSISDREKRRSYRATLFDYGRVEMRRLGARIFPSRSDGIASRLLLDSLARVVEM
jgi:pimeloyl-ACP methyl ester carboxylesterase